MNVREERKVNDVSQLPFLLQHLVKKTVVIWKSENPRCLRELINLYFLVHYYSQKKAWMDTKVVESLLTKLYDQFIKEKWSILLFSDAGCHPDNMETNIVLKSNCIFVYHIF